MSMRDDVPAEVDADTSRVAIDWTRREPVTLAVQRAVGDVTNCAQTDLPPLADYVDPDALEALFGDDVPDDRRFSFRYADHEICIEGTGHVIVD
jgi:hypothetical protein